jgi:uncharacterized membrane protein
MRKVLWVLGGGCMVGAVTLLVYRGILFPPAGDSVYPWASDTLGQLVKAEYLARNLEQGILYPDLLPGWYMGLQMMRYHPPLPYYLLVGLTSVVGDPIAAANWFIALCAMAGGLAWLLYRRWVGWLPALAGGILFTFLPDNVRVALAEGNLPRVLATAILPLAVFFLLRSLEESGTAWHRFGLALCFAVIVLCHAMMAAIYGLCAVMLAMLCWLGRVARFRQVILTVLTVALGILLSGWWLLPSFTGGITELDSSAMTEALAVFPLTNYFNPLLRMGNPEAVYVGATLIALAVASLALHTRADSHPVALVLTGAFGVLITTSGFNQFFNALPLHGLLWPLRFLGIASFVLLLAVMWSLRAWGQRSLPLALGLVALLALDGSGSLSLIHLRPLPPDIAAISQKLATSPGWRVATLDQSSLGSAPSYFFSALGGRQQIFGWAYQGARTARTVAALNESMTMGYTAYLLDRLERYGVDDVVLLNQSPSTTRLQGALVRLGFRQIYAGETASLYHRDGGPRACLAHWSALGIGRGVQNIAYLFPQIVLGTSNRVDDYSVQELSNYQTVVLSGFDWHDRQASEDLIKEAAASGVRVVVDLTGAPVDPLARIPRFLEVWGEQVILSQSPTRIQSASETGILQPPGEPAALWYTHMLQGLQTEVWSFDYLGERSILMGYNTYGQGQVWFIGLNLPYHAALTHDPLAIELLSGLLALPPDGSAGCDAVPLANYRADQDGYRFNYRLEAPGRLFIPVAYLEGMQTLVDGVPVIIHSFEQLVAFEAPAGEHSVEIRLRPTPIYQLGQVATVLSGMALLGLLVFDRRLKQVGYAE